MGPALRVACLVVALATAAACAIAEEDRSGDQDGQPTPLADQVLRWIAGR